MADNRDFKGVWIPKEIWLSEELNLQEKCLLVEIDSLSNLGRCYASNDHFAKFLRLSKDRVSKMISGLRDKGYIEVTLTYKPGSKEIDERIITTIGYRQKQLEGIVKNNGTPVGENNDTPIVKNAKDNNTVLKNTVFKNTHTDKKALCVEIASQVESVLGEKIGKKKLESLIKECGIERLNKYLGLWSKYSPFALKGQSNYFIHVVENELPVPQPKKINSSNNKGVETFRDFDQRNYTEEEFEKFYANLND